MPHPWKFLYKILKLKKKATHIPFATSSKTSNPSEYRRIKSEIPDGHKKKRRDVYRIHFKSTLSSQKLKWVHWKPYSAKVRQVSRGKAHHVSLKTFFDIQYENHSVSLSKRKYLGNSNTFSYSRYTLCLQGIPISFPSKRRESKQVGEGGKRIYFCSSYRKICVKSFVK